MNCKIFDSTFIESFLDIENKLITENGIIKNYRVEQITPPLDKDLSRDTEFNHFEKSEFCYIVYQCDLENFKMSAMLFEGVVEEYGKGVFVQLNTFSKNDEFIDAIILYKLFYWEIEYYSKFLIENNCIINIYNFEKYPDEDSLLYDGSYPPGHTIEKRLKYGINENGIFYLQSLEIID